MGTRAFGPADADHFYGRTRETWELTSKIRNHRLVVVHGRPGVGKSSLLAAGVLPSLGDEAHVLPVASPTLPSVRPTTRPAGPCPDETANPLVLGLLSAWSSDRSAGEPRGLSIHRFLQELRGPTEGLTSSRRPLVAVMDPFDGLLRDHPAIDPVRTAFLDQLVQAMDVVDDLHLVLVMGSDVVPRLARREVELSGGDRCRYEVHALARAAALEAVEGPLQATDRSFGPAVADELVDQLRTRDVTDEVGEMRTTVAPTVEPTSLQIVCSALWHNLPGGVGVITTQHLEAHGDVEIATTDYCVRAVVEVAAREAVPIRKVWEWLEATFITDRGTPATAYEGLLETAGMPNSVARALEGHRVLGTEERSGTVWFELLHAGLVEPVRHGRRLADWLTQLAGHDLLPVIYLQVAESVLQSGTLRLVEDYARDALPGHRSDVKTLAEAKSFLGNLLLRLGLAESGLRAEQLYALAEDNLRDAAELFETEQDNSAVGRAMASLGRLLIERGRVADALSELRSALDRLRDDVDVRLDFARALHDSGQLHAALGEYTAVLTVAPENAEALARRGTINATYGRSTAAWRDLDAAVRLDPSLASRNDVVAARGRALAHGEGGLSL